MRARAAALLATALIPLLAPAATATAPCIVLAEIEADPDTTLGEREFVELWNCGFASQPLAGWRLRDAPTSSGATNTFTFPEWSLPANGRVVVWGGGAGDARGPAWGNPTIWNNAGDAASLLDPDGALVDWLGYGATAPPNGTAWTVQAKPGHGQSLQLDGSNWTLAAPTPGLALGASSGGMEVNVTNAAPAPAFGALPRWVRPGAAASIPIVAGDPNGDADVAGWTLRSGANVLAGGEAGGPQEVVATAPTAGSAWDLELQVTDRAGLSTSVRATLPLRFGDLVVETPANAPLRFPAGAPGSGLEATAAAVVRNLGEQAVVPRLDVSDFAGPASFAAEGSLSVGWDDGQGGTAWTPYDGPLMPLPAVPAGGDLAVAFRVILPAPLPAGLYGTTFAVVA